MIFFHNCIVWNPIAFKARVLGIMPPTAKILLENPDLSQKYASAFAKEAKLKEALKFAVVMYMMVIWTMGKIVLL